jgi:hypothetical protein
MRHVILACWLAALSPPALAQDLLTEVTGNWAGLQENSYWFRARLVDDGGAARLMVWNGDLLSEPRTPSLDITGIVRRVGKGATDAQGLAVNVLDRASELVIVTKTADARYVTEEKLYIRFVGTQFLVVGYAQSSADITTGDDVLDCNVDLVSDLVLLNGEPRNVPVQDVAVKNAALWTATSAVDLGYCPARD